MSVFRGPVRRLRLVAVVAGAAAAVMAGCGGAEDPRVATADTGRAGPATATAAANADVAAYIEAQRRVVACLRGEGLDVSDPDATTGQITFRGDLGALKADPAFGAAQLKCRSLAVPVPESVQELRKPKLSPEQVKIYRDYATCMQGNGAPDFPDPGPDGYPPRGTGWDQTSAGARRATRACASIIGDPTDAPTARG